MNSNTAINIYQVDAFSSTPFGGNPAAVCVLETALDEKTMQNIAAEMNQAETAFLCPSALNISTDNKDSDNKSTDGPNHFSLRWFTPTTEVDLCGHATLASAHCLWESGQVPFTTDLHFATRSGELIARRKGQLVEIDLPAAQLQDYDDTDNIALALGTAVLSAKLGGGKVLAEVSNAEAVYEAQPDLKRIAQIPVNGIIITAQAQEDDLDFISRFFGPNVGIDEDHVTGSAHCCLTPFWSERLGKTTLSAYQASARGGHLQCRLDKDRIYIAGTAVTTLKGQFYA